MDIAYPAAVARNKQTGLFHPIRFEPQHTRDKDLCKFFSRGYHMRGFKTIDEARQSIADNRCCPMRDTGMLFEWDGRGNPAFVCTLSRSKYGFPTSV